MGSWGLLGHFGGYAPISPYAVSYFRGFWGLMGATECPWGHIGADPRSQSACACIFVLAFQFAISSTLFGICCNSTEFPQICSVQNICIKDLREDRT
jgi:hypothetical protein